jgi:hypothetical protein
MLAVAPREGQSVSLVTADTCDEICIEVRVSSLAEKEAVLCSLMNYR